MKCENCGKEIHTLSIDTFNHDGSDRDIEVPIDEGINDDGTEWVRFWTGQNWCAYELSEEEQHDSILCPICRKPAFKKAETQVYDIVEVVKFKEAE